jgi:GNAT superfamily N-acetyltransferase
MTAGLVGLDMRPLAPSDQRDVLALLQTSLAGGPTGERTVDFFRWKHVDNPFGASLALGAFDGPRLVGLRLVMRWRFRLDDRQVTAGRMVDTATDPDYRGRGIFQQLTAAALGQARGDIELIFNTPNASSRPGYLKMGWRDVSVVATSFAPVRPLRFARGARSALSAGGQRTSFETTSGLPHIGDVLTAHEHDVRSLLAARRDSGGSRLVTDSDVEYLRWRYARAPGLDYRAVPILRDGRLRALGIGRVRPRGRLRELTLAEVIASPGADEDVRRVLRASRRSGVDHVATHLPASVAPPRLLRRCGFLTSSRVGLTLTARPLADLPVDPLASSSWDLSLGDIEVF